jgi:hypothetical protein
MRPEHRTFNAGNWTLDRFAQNLLIAFVSKLVMKYVAIKQRVVANMQVAFFAVTSTARSPSMHTELLVGWEAHSSSLSFEGFQELVPALASLTLANTSAASPVNSRQCLQCGCLVLVQLVYFKSQNLKDDS